MEVNRSSTMAAVMRDVPPNIVVLLTATCAVHPDVTYSRQRDSDTRTRAYGQALAHWLRTTSFPIVLVENSDRCHRALDDYVPIGVECERRFEHISFAWDACGETDKGYGEWVSICRALRDSRFLRNADFIVKFTGRYVPLHRAQEQMMRIFGNCRDVDAIVRPPSKRDGTTDSRVFGGSQHFFRNVLAASYERGRGAVFERNLGRWAASPQLAAARGVRRFDDDIVVLPTRTGHNQLVLVLSKQLNNADSAWNRYGWGKMQQITQWLEAYAG